MTPSLENTVALVTGASRGIGKGIAIALAERGALVYLTGRTLAPFEGAVQLDGSLPQTEEEIRSKGGRCVAIACDHADDTQTAALFERIEREQGRLDLLVNAAWGGYEHYNDGTEFWKETGFWDVPLSRWDKSFTSGVRITYVASAFAARSMIRRRRGLIVNLSYWAAQRSDKGAAYSASKAATDKLTECMAWELRDSGVAVVTLYPGLVRTEGVLKAKDFFDLSNSESPEFAGIAIANLFVDPELASKSGRIWTSADLAIEYGFADVDGKRPIPLTRENS